MRSASEALHENAWVTTAKAGKSMRRMVVMAGWFATVLAMVGCAASGPSKGDLADINEALATMPSGWTLKYIDGENSSSEGVSRDLTVSATHSGVLTSDDLRAFIQEIVDAVPSRAKYLIVIHVALSSPDVDFPDIATQAREVGLRQFGGDYGMGEMYGTRAQFAEALEGGS